MGESSHKKLSCESPGLLKVASVLYNDSATSFIAYPERHLSLPFKVVNDDLVQRYLSVGLRFLLSSPELDRG